jgi:hypothetical protein
MQNIGKNAESLNLFLKIAGQLILAEAGLNAGPVWLEFH